MNGIRNKAMELKQLLFEQKIHVAVIQETKLSGGRLPTFPEYSPIQLDRPGGGRGGGLLILIHKDLHFTNTTQHTRTEMARAGQLDNITEIQTVRVCMHKHHIHIANIYIPPTSSQGLLGYEPKLDYLNTLPKALILGDFNAHDTAWYDNCTPDSRGALILDQLNNLNILNNTNIPTLKPFNTANNPTSPDISLAAPEIALRSTWTTTQALTSDHVPIIITYALNTLYTPSLRRTYTNYKRADWDKFTNKIEEELQHKSIEDFANIDAATTFFNRTITNNSKKYIPAGHRQRFNPTFSADIKRNIQTRNQLREQTPTPNTLDQINTLNTEINEGIKREQHNKWSNYLNTVNFRSNPAKVWKLVKGLDNKYNCTTKTHEAIMKNNTEDIPDTKKQAEILITHYAKMSSLPNRAEDRRRLREFHAQNIDHNITTQFTPVMTWRTIKSTKNSSSTGPDNISYIHLKHLGPHAIRLLTEIFNHSITHNAIPNIWKRASILPIPKEGKTPTDPGSHRPISLLCNTAKILERLVLNNINDLIPVSPFQHGFRPKHSTSTLLTNLSQTTLDGFNKPQPPLRTLTAAIDINKAFDTIPRHLLIEKIHRTQIPINYQKWLANFLSGRQAFVILNNKHSSTRQMRNGVPQGSVLSPTLFNLYTHDMPTPTQSNVKLMTYADDITITSQHHKHAVAAEQLQIYLNTLHDWFHSNRLKISAHKSSLTLLTPDTREHSVQPQVNIGGEPIPVVNNPTILGLTLDKGYHFHKHMETVTTKAKKRLNVLRAVTKTTFGHSKEDTTLLYKQFIRSKMTDVHTAWHPHMANAHLDAAQRVQNAALQVITGCTKKTPVQHLHDETKVLMFRDHLDMRGTHFYDSTHAPDHPLHYMRSQQPVDRNMRKTPAKYYSALHESLPPCPEGTSMRTHIHTVITRRALANYEPNRLLGTRPPPISEEEKTLPRADRVQLARLRCGYSTLLPSYLERIGVAESNQCLICQGAVGDTIHILLHCPSLQQHRSLHNIQSLEDLWTKPVEVVSFLRDAGVLQ